AASFLVGGWNWPRLYWSVLRDPRIDPDLPGWSVRAALDLLRLPSNVEIILEIAIGLCIAGLVVVIARHAPPLVGLAAAAIGGLLINRHVPPSDLMMLVPAGFAVVSYTKNPLSRATLALAVCPILYVFLSIRYLIVAGEIGLLMMAA